jgi:hypothetical protein
MRVQVTVKGATFWVPCGEGDQSLKWLSLVAAQQYELRKPQGRARYREPANSKRGFFIPSGMSSAKGVAFRDPTAKVCDVFQDGASVTVELQETVVVDSINAPVQTDWQQKCFCEGPASKLRISSENLRKEEELRHSAELLKLEKDAKNRKRMEQAGAMDGMSVGSNFSVNVQEYGIQAVNGAADWSMIADVVGETSKKDQDELEEYFPVIFPVLNDIYAHFAGQRRNNTNNNKNSKGDNASMSFAEFSHFLHAARVEHAYKDSDVIREYVLTTKRRLARSSSNESKSDVETEDFITRIEFLAACIVVGIQKADGTMRSSGSVEALLKKYLEPNWLEPRSATKVRVLIDGPRTNTMLTDSRPYLKEVFDHYTSDIGGVMTEECFASVMKEAGILMRQPGEGNDSAEERMNALAANSFFGAQGFPPRHLELNELVFAEFIEATCRLSLESLNTSAEEFARVQLGVDALLDLRRNIR